MLPENDSFSSSRHRCPTLEGCLIPLLSWKRDRESGMARRDGERGRESKKRSSTGSKKNNRELRKLSGQAGSECGGWQQIRELLQLEPSAHESGRAEPSSPPGWWAVSSYISAPCLHGDVSPPPPGECFAGAAVRFNYMCSNYDRF